MGRCSAAGVAASALLLHTACSAPWPAFPPELVGDHRGLIVALERDPSTPLEVTALELGSAPIEFEVPADVERVWFRLYEAPLDLYLERLGPQAQDPMGRALPRTDESYALDLSLSVPKWERQEPSSRFDEVRVSGPVACATFTKVAELTERLPDEILARLGWNQEGTRVIVLAGRSGRRWALDPNLELTELESLPRPAGISAAAQVLQAKSHTTGLSFFLEEGGIVLETMLGFETLVFPHGSIAAGSYSSGFSDRWLLVLNDQGELYAHVLGSGVWERLHTLQTEISRNLRLEISGESSFGFAVLDPDAKTVFVGSRSAVVETMLETEGRPLYLGRFSGLYVVATDRGEVFQTGPELLLSLALRAHFDAQVTAISLVDSALEPDVPWTFGFADGSFAERLPTGVICPSQPALSVPLQGIGRLPRGTAGASEERLLVVGRQTPDGEFSAALFSLRRP